jgi:hypothetical protein
MNDKTGEIRNGSEDELKELFVNDSNWRPLNLKTGQTIEIEGFKFMIQSAKINPGKPGRITLKLKGMGK